MLHGSKKTATMTSAPSSRGADLGEFNPNASVSLDEIHTAHNGKGETPPFHYCGDESSLYEFIMKEGNWPVDGDNVDMEVVHDPHPEVFAGIVTDDEASGVHSNEGDSWAPAVAPPQILPDDKKGRAAFYKSFQKQGTKSARTLTHLLLTLPRPETLGIDGDGKSQEMVDAINDGLSAWTNRRSPEKTRRVDNCVIVKEVVGGVTVLRMAFEIEQDTGTKMTMHSFLSMLYQRAFPKYNYKVQVHDHTCYPNEVAELVAPREAREGMDTEPLVFGDRKAVQRAREEADKRAAKGQPKPKRPAEWWEASEGLLKAALEAKGSLSTFQARQEYREEEEAKATLIFERMNAEVLPFVPLLEHHPLRIIGPGSEADALKIRRAFDIHDALYKYRVPGGKKRKRGGGSKRIGRKKGRLAWV